jgi:lipopolysaccharide transport system permease protein
MLNHLKRKTAAPLGLSTPESPTWRFRIAYSKDLMRELISRDLKIRYKRSVLGIGWSLAKPLSQLLIFAFLFNKIIPLNIPNYTAFLFIGVLVWSWFGGAVTASAQAVTGSPELIRRPNFPLLALPALTVSSNAIHFVIALPLLLVFTVSQVGFPGIPVLALPVLIILQLFFTLGIACLVAAVQVRFRDTQHLVGISVMFGFYITPVFYQRNSVPDALRWIYDANPMAVLLGGYRDILLHHQWPALSAILFLCFAAAVSLTLGIGVFKRLSVTFVEEV